MIYNLWWGSQTCDEVGYVLANYQQLQLGYENSRGDAADRKAAKGNERQAGIDRRGKHFQMETENMSCCEGETNSGLVARGLRGGRLGH